MKGIVRTCAGGAVVVAGALASGAGAAEWTKLVDTSTPLPGAAGRTVYTLSAPSLSGDNAVFATEFAEFSGLWQGVFARIDGQLVKVFDDTTPYPGVAGTRLSDTVFTPTIDGGDVAFQAYATDPAIEGIFSWSNGQITKVVDTSTTIPGASVPFFTFGGPHVRDGKVVFAGVEEEGDASGIYTNAGTATFRPVVDFGAALPGGGGTFNGFPYLMASETLLPDGRAIFLARGKKDAEPGNFFGIFIGGGGGAGGVQTLVEERVTPIPSGSGGFNDLRLVVADDDASFAFEGLGAGGQRGIYASEDGVLRKVVDGNTPIPGGSGNFSWEHRNLVDTLLSYDDGGVLFEGFGANDYSGIFYAAPDGTVMKLIDGGDVLDGKAVASAFIDRGSLDGGRAGVWVQFEDGSEGIYITVVPEPTMAGAVLALAGAVCRHRRRRPSLTGQPCGR